SISVSTAPGLTQIALMPCSLPSVAIASVRPMTPYLETLYAASPGNFSVAYTPESEPKLTMRPSPERRIELNAARQQRNEPVRLTSRESVQTSGVISSTCADLRTPAAQTRAEMLPNSPANEKRRSTASASLTSVGCEV